MQLKYLQEFTQIAEASGGFFTEAKGYSDAGEFTDEFYDLFAQVTKMKKVMKNEKWLSYLKLSDIDKSTSTQEFGRDAIKAIIALEEALQLIDREFDRAKGHSEDGAGDDADTMPNDGLDDVRANPRGR